MNMGPQSITIASVASSSSQFKVTGPALPLIVNPGQGASFQVLFAPTSGGNFSGSINLSLNRRSRGVASVVVSGTGVATAQTLRSIAVTPSNPSISPSQTQQFTAMGTYSDGSAKDITASVTWASSNTAVASVGVNSGVATGLSAGSAQITATLGSVISPSDNLTIKAITLQSIGVSPANPSISPSQTQQFTATGTYSDGSSKNITASATWTSSNTAVAMVGANTGLASGVSAGTAQITATLGSVVSPSPTLTVVKSITLQSIAVSPANPSINRSQTQQFTATGTYSDSSSKVITASATWTSSNTAVATIGVNSGLATGISGGSSQITATLGGIVSPGDTLTVKAATLQSIAVSPSNPSINQSQSQQFTATGTYSDASSKDITGSVTWTSSNTAIATIGANSGIATGISAGASQITATLGGVVSASDVLTVNSGAQTSTYSTTFPLTENPISEGHKWINGGTCADTSLCVGLDWKNVQTTPNFAFGTQTGNGTTYDDSTAILAGTWGPNQTVTVQVLHSGPYAAEMEIRLHTTVTAHNITGYEILCMGGPVMQIVRWEGALGAWNIIASGSTPCSPNDIFKGTIVNNSNGSVTINAFINGSPVLSVTDSGSFGPVFRTGNPGIGFFNDGGAPVTSNGIVNFTATMAD
jgi:uncharacterized protein YjdB